MTDNARRDLGYGRLGPVIYDKQGKIWQYGRELGRTRALRLCSNCPELLRSQLSSDQSDAEPANDPQEHSVTKLTKEFSELTKRYPELRLAQPFFTPFAKESEAIQSATKKYDPLAGDLLAYGYTSTRDDADGTSSEVLAVPDGDNGERLTLYQIEKQAQYDWNQGNPQLRIATPTAVAGSWIGPGVPIRQIVFSRPSDSPPSDAREDSGCFVAIRLWEETGIFRSILRGDGDSSITHDAPAPTTGRLQPLIRISEEMTGGLEHTDVAFNPWNTDQLAIVDSSGNMAVFEVRANTSNNDGLLQEYSMLKLGLYDVPRPSDQEDEPTNSPPKEWSRVLWIASPTTIMICTRTAITFVDSRRMSSLDPELQIPKLGLKASSNWMLDIRRHPVRLDQVFVLTSTHVFWLYICLNEDLVDHQGPAFGVNVFSSIRHFRGPSDLSLKLTVFITGDERSDSISTRDDITRGRRSDRITRQRRQAQEKEVQKERYISLLLSSELNYVITCYRIQDSREPMSSQKMVCDPVSIILEPSPSSQLSKVRILNLALRSAAFVEQAEEISHDASAALLRDAGLEVWDLQMLTSDLQLRRWLLWSVDRSSPLQGTGAFEISESTIQSQFRSLRLLSVQNGASSQTGQRSEDSDRTVPTALQDPTYVALDLRPIYKLLGAPMRQSEGDESGAVDVVATMRALYQNLERRPEACGEPMESLIEQISAYETVGDVDSASAAFHGLLQLVVPADGPDEMPIAVQRISSASRASPGPSDTILSGIYRSLVRSMLTPLPPKIPGRVRLVLEALARKVSTDVCLASARTELESRDPVDEIDDTQELESLSQNPPESYFSSRDLHTSSQQSILSGWESSASIPPVSVSGLPSPRTTPSLRLSTISSSTIQASYSNLKRYVAFSKPLPIAQPQTARSLAHWTTGVDPATYSWMATQHAIENLEEAAVEDSGLTQRERKRLRKRAERLIKKQRAEARKHVEREVELSSQPVVIATSSRGELVHSPPLLPSGPQTLSLPFLSSQPLASQTQSSQMPVVVVSQIEPGRHGGRGMRPPPRKKKRAGF